MESFKTSIQHWRAQITQEEHKRDTAKTSFNQYQEKIRATFLVAILRMGICSLLILFIAIFMSRFDQAHSFVYTLIWAPCFLGSTALIAFGSRYMVLFVGVDAWKKYKKIVVENDYSALEIEPLYTTYRQHITRLREMRKNLRCMQKEYAVYKQNMCLRAQEYLVVHCRDTDLKEYLLSVLK